MKKYNMLTDSPGKSLFFFALPMILGNLFQQFYTTVDSIIVGQFVGEDALAAIGASTLNHCLYYDCHRRRDRGIGHYVPVFGGRPSPKNENFCLHSVD